MFESFAAGNRARTFLLLGALAVLAAAAAVVGIDDNTVGISLVVLAGFCAVLVFVHPWREPARFKRLIVLSVVGLVGLFGLGAGLQVLVEMARLSGTGPQILASVGMAFLLASGFLCVPGLLIGIGGAILCRKRERRERPAA